MGILRPMNKQNGFSLIEALVTMTIAAIVLSVGIPSFQSFIQNNRQTIAINELATALQLARSTAVTRSQQATVCKSSNGTDCTTDGTWTQGWIVFADPNNNNSHDAGEEILRVHGAIQGDGTLTGNLNVANLVAFKPQGVLASLNGTITYCDSRGHDHASALVISRGGHIRFENDGSLLTC